MLEDYSHTLHKTSFRLPRATRLLSKERFRLSGLPQIELVAPSVHKRLLQASIKFASYSRICGAANQPGMR
jgi:hypothetical protein